MLAGCALAGTDLTGDALLTQRTLARYLLERQAHYYCTVKGNPPARQGSVKVVYGDIEQGA